MSTRQLKDLKEAGYNPRVISSKRLENLHKSMTTYGDLSGVVFNRKTKTLISGHQRLKPLRGSSVNTKIVTKPVTDEFGTVAEGHIVAVTSAGTLRIPYREVDWSDKKAEIAANIAANAHGGDFDRAKLGTLLEKLDVGKKFDINILGLDPLSIRNLMPKLPTLGTDGPDENGEESFQEYGEESFDFQHTCPKCKFQFNESAASKPKKAKPEPKAPKLKVSKKAKEEAKAKAGKSSKPKSKAKEDLKKAKAKKAK